MQFSLSSYTYFSLQNERNNCCFHTEKNYKEYKIGRKFLCIKIFLYSLSQVSKRTQFNLTLSVLFFFFPFLKLFLWFVFIICMLFPSFIMYVAYFNAFLPRPRSPAPTEKQNKNAHWFLNIYTTISSACITFFCTCY